MNIINDIKNETWLFTEEEINQAIIDINNDSDFNDIQSSMPDYIVLYCYKNRGIITKEEYMYDVMQYIYLHSQDSKEMVDNTIKQNQQWFNSYYEDAVNGNITFYHAVQDARESLLHLFHKNFD